MPNFGNDIFFATAGELNTRLKAREFSCRDLTRAFLDRMNAAGPRYNLLALATPKEAGKCAGSSDSDIKIERFRGPLQGVPYVVGDVLSMASRPTAWGSPALAAQKFDFDSTVVDKLNDPCAVPLGKVAVVELAGAGGYRLPSASATGACRNPWDPDRWAGGVSAGAAAAVAAGLASFAVSIATSDALLSPCADCGVTGFRPSYGLVSRYGLIPASWTMDTVGVAARSVDDCAQAMHGIAGGDISDPASGGKGYYVFPQFSRSPEKLKLGYLPRDFEEIPSGDARAAFRAALDTFRQLGALIQPVEIPDLPYAAMQRTIAGAEAAAAFEDFATAGHIAQMVDPFQAAGLRAAQEIPARDYLRAQRIRALARDAFNKLLIDIDILVSPTRYAPALPLDTPLAANPRDNGVPDIVTAGGLVGIPALTLPCGFVGNLPVGITISGRAFTENTLVALGLAFQSKTDWHRRHPIGLPF